MRPRAWWLVGPALVAAMGIAYVVGAHVVDPYPSSPFAGAATTVSANVGTSRYVELAIPPAVERLAPHLTSVTPVGGSRGLYLRFETGTSADPSDEVRVEPLHCATTPARPVDGTPLSRAPSTVLRVIITASRRRTYRLSGVDLSWSAGLFHGTVFCALPLTVRAAAPAFVPARCP